MHIVTKKKAWTNVVCLRFQSINSPSHNLQTRNFENPTKIRTDAVMNWLQSGHSRVEFAQDSQSLYDGKGETCFVSEPSCIEDTMSKIVIPRLQIVTGRIDTLESQTHHIRPILLLQCHWHQLYNTARRMLSLSLTKFHYCQPENDTDCLHLHQTVVSSTCL